ncbi:hypothetical protein [Flaviaesturariibacter amylovorans]|uniref:Lipoprotein n=1 Tax=Flaviaesturariibacter amylovorans TaxID=1084520 RepID=A0ABP8HMK3_9BACT
MRFIHLPTIFLLIVGCKDKPKETPVNIAGVYAIEVSSPYGITRDTIEVKTQSVQQSLYTVTHKVCFIKKRPQGDSACQMITKVHMATYEEHLGHLQDIHDGTIFRLYHDKEAISENTANYKRIE